MLNRLESIVLERYGNFSNFAKILGKSHSLFYTYKNKNKIGNKLLKEIEVHYECNNSRTKNINDNSAEYNKNGK